MTAFVGREKELGELEEALSSAFAGRGRLVLIGGEPGIGKSRLADELADRAAAQGAKVIVGRCWEAGGAPAFWPWVQALRALVRGRDPQLLHSQLGVGAPDLAQLLPELHDVFPAVPDPPSLESEGARFRLFDAVASFLRNAAEDAPLVVVLDDLHASDAPSLLLLRFVGRELGASRMLVICLYRDVDPTPPDALVSAIAELVRERPTSQIALTGLSDRDVAEYIERSSGITPPPELVQAVHAETEGNPLFVAEVVRLLEAEGRLGDADAYLRIPPGVRAVLERRLGRLSERCRSVLASASILGREFGLEAVERLSELSRGELLDVLDEALSERVVGELPGSPGRLVFAHELIRDTLYDGLASARRLRLHQQAGEILEDVYAADLDPHLAEIAYHFRASASAAATEKAIDYARRAGDKAASQLAYEEAARLYEMALTLAKDETDRCDLLLALGDAQTAAGEAAIGVESFLAAAEIARRLDSSELLARAALGCGGRFLWSRGGNDPRVVTLVRDALDAIGPGDSPSRARLLARYSSMLRGRLPRDQQDAMSREAVEIARRLDDPVALARALWSRRVFAWEPEKAVEDLALSEEIVRLSDAAADWEYGVETRLFRSHAHLVLGDIAATHADVEEAARLAADRQLPAIVWHITVHRVELALLEGRFRDAEELLGRAYELAQRSERADALGSHATQSYALRRELGGVERVEQNLVWLAADRPERALPRCLLAELDCTLGRQGRARTTLLDLVADSCQAIPRDLGWALSMAMLAEVAAALDEKTAATVLYEQLLPAAELVIIDPHEFSAGAAARPLGLLAETCGRFDDAERHFRRALELNDAIGARPWLAHTRHDFAQMLLQRAGPGDRENARELLMAALATCRELGMEPLATSTSALLSEVETERDAAEAFAGYRIEDVVGRGGMGVVYRATDLRLERPVALKLIAPELATDEDFRKRFLRESKLAASLGHPHILPVHAAGEENGQLYLAMRLVEGEDLKALIARESKLDARRALNICGQIAEALDAAHHRGLVHRDVKPANVLLDEEGQAYLADFGLTKQVGGASTRSGEIAGTLDYLAPEQIRGEQIAGATDQYALACVLYECFDGQPPFHRRTEAEVLWAHMQDHPPHLREVPELDPVFARALAKEKDERFPTCAEFVDSAREALGYETPRVRRRHRLLRRSRVLLAAGVLVIAGATAALVVALTGAESVAPIVVQPNSVVAIDPTTHRLVAAVAVGEGPTRIAVSDRGIWAINETSNTVSLIEPNERKVLRTFAVGAAPSDVVVHANMVWVANPTGVTAVDPDTLSATKRIVVGPRGQRLFPGRARIAVGLGSLWFASSVGTLWRIGPKTGKVIGSLDLGYPQSGQGGIAFGGDSVWVAGPWSGSGSAGTGGAGGLIEIDPRTMSEVGRIQLGSGLLTGLVSARLALWAPLITGGLVWQVGPIGAETGPVRSIAVGEAPTGIASGFGSLWVTNGGDGTVSRIDLASAKVIDTIDIGGSPAGVAVGNGLVWVTVD